MLRSAALGALAIFVLALAARLVTLFALYGLSTPDPIFTKYLLLAEELVNNQWTFPLVFAYSPLYIYLVAVLKWLSQDQLLLVMVGQVVLGASGCSVLFLLARTLFGNREAWIAGVLAGVFHQFLLYETEFLSDSLGAVLWWLSVWLVLLMGNSSSRWLPLASGMAIGLAGLQRPTALLLLPAALVWLLARRAFPHKTDWALVPSLMIVGACATVLPITLHNLRVGEDFVPVMSSGGYVLYSSNNHRATGAQYFPPSVNMLAGRARIGPWTLENLAFYDDDLISRHIASKVQGRELKPSEASNFWSQETKRYVLEYPREFMRLLGRKLVFILHTYEVHDLESIVRKERYFRFGLWKIFTALLMPLGFLGLISTFSKWREFIWLYLALGVACLTLFPFYVVARYKLPLLGLMIILAAHALVTLVHGIRMPGSSGIRLLKQVVGLAVLVAACNLPYPAIRKQAKIETMANLVLEAERELGSRPQLAATRLSEAIAMDPLAPKAFTAHALLARVHESQGRADLAEEERRKAVMSHPEVEVNALSRLIENPRDREALHVMGLIRLRERDFDAAAQHLKSAVEIRPAHPRTRTHYAQALVGLGPSRYREALEALERALRDGERLETVSARLHLKAALLGLKLNQPERAMPHVQQAVFEMPESVEARLVKVVALQRLGQMNEAETQLAKLSDSEQSMLDPARSEQTIQEIEARFLYR